MAFLDDLSKATQMFDQGMTKLATTRAFSEANKQIADLNQQALSEAEKAAELNKLSQGLAQDLLQAGASTGQVQQAFQAFSPVKPQTGAELIARGDVSGGQTLQRQQTQVEQERKLELLSVQNMLRQQAATGEKKKTIPVGQLEKIQAADVSRESLQDILSTLDRLSTDTNTGKGKAKTVRELLPTVDTEGGGGVVGLISGLNPLGIRGRVSPEFADFDSRIERMFQQFRVATTGAQASEEELKRLRPLIPRTTESPEVFRQKTQSLMKELEKVRNKRLQNLEKTGFDVSGFKDNTISEVAKQEQTLKLSPQMQQASEWLKNNPDHPRAEAVRQTIERALRSGK